MSDGEYAELNK
jgi:Ran GTPase-activating protein (RanGAP) involved in mRNA processing and transport